MKVAILTITKDAQNLAIQITEALEDDPTILKVDTFHKNVKLALNEVFDSHDCIIGIMAAGIMVRNICEFLKGKLKDPAVLVIDEKGKHVISLISGHFGGANEFTLKITNIIGAKPVITTATDLNGKFGIDSLAKKYYLNINNPKMIKTINSAILEDKEVKLKAPSKFSFVLGDPELKESYSMSTSETGKIEASVGYNKLTLEPKKFVVGLGARKNISSENVIKAIEFAMNTLRLPLERIDTLATGEMKKNETGIIEASSKIDVPLEIVPLDTLKNFKDPQCSDSPFVRQKFGVSGICEPSALIAAGRGSRLIFKKTALNGVTVAVAVSND